MASPIERELSNDLLDKVVELGYTFGKCLGAGSCGAAYRCNWTNLITHETKLIAVKHIDFNKIKRNRQQGLISQKISDPQVLNTLRVEVVAMNRVNHPNVVSLQNYLQFEDDAQDTGPSHLLIFMDIAVCDLKDYQGLRDTFNEEKTCNFSAQIARGLAHIHSRGIAHFDLKPGNILVFNDPSMKFGVTLKITDFGLSLLFPIEPHGNTILAGTSTQVREFIGGTPPFRDPVIDFILVGDHDRVCDAFKADIWSYGVTVWYLFFGSLKGNQIYLKKQEVMMSPRRRTQFNLGTLFMLHVNNAKISPAMTQFFQRIFMTNQEERMSAANVCDHRWLANEIILVRERQPSFS